MKPSDRIKGGVFRLGTAWDMSEAFLNLLDYLDELHEQRESGPELWAVVAVDANGNQVWCRVHNHTEDARADRDNLSRDLDADRITHSKVATFRLARFRGEFVE